ncbi:cysteine ABC transporter ATP-binding protein [Clostridium baratii]|uniref:ABC transporter ATP-binding protein/permease n=1 Tax=Clostridium baratii TaxID=1561 RepID=UPI0009A440A3|nr:ABC transporter ATP-binding protein/permease [Clostridium baratii]OPF54478.1 cysteine ABC transporter ATP-binding protein [Clostridium baratii]OPF55479.1 cysteine ABC transporter ATP-binding protein [Clostridium baratii]OPF60140.1 cysteine ABC transporter ATP-binding protein [Clostridium baratii]
MMINKRLINLCKESKKYIGLTVFSNWVVLLCNLIMILLIGKIINKVYYNIEALKGVGFKEFIRNDIGTYLLIFLGLLIVRFTFNVLYGYFSNKSSDVVKVKLRDMIYEKLLNLGLDYNKNLSTSSIVQSAIEGVEALEIYFGKYLSQLFYSLLAPITLFFVISFISFKAAVVFILCVPLIPISIIAIMKFAKRLLKNYWNNYSNLGETFLENLQGLTTLKVFNIDEIRHKKMNEEAEGFRKITMKVLSMQLNSITVMDLIAFGGAALGSIVSLVAFKNGQINLGQTIIIILLSSEFFIPLRLLGSFFHVAMNGVAASDKIFELLDSKERKKNTIEDTSDLDKININLNDVTFSYDNKRDVLKNISLNIKNKGFTAIVGRSGSGKSTIANLLLNTYEVNKGEIMFNNTNLNNISFDDIYEKIMLINTNSYIFNGTILDNLKIAKEDLTDNEIQYALELSNLKSFVDGLKDGINTKVGEGGSLLSGGQKQRLALARAVLSNREIYIFDEATSNVDVESEEIILDAINKLAKEKTVIVISHRLANVKNADVIYVLDNGEIVESGNHVELIKKENHYFNMIKEQEFLERREVV